MTDGEKDEIVSVASQEPQAAARRWSVAWWCKVYSAAEKSCQNATVDSGALTHLSSLVVVSNLIFIGFDVDYNARHWNETVSQTLRGRPVIFTILTVAYFVFFLLEVCVRMFAWKSQFWKDWTAWLDLLLVLVQGFEVAHDFSLFDGSYSTSVFSVLRLCRGLRLCRVSRLLRLVTAFQQLAMMLDAISASFKALVWVLALILLVTYGVGILLTEIVSEFRQVERESMVDGELEKLFDNKYGSLDRTMLMLYEVITGGINWNEVSEPVTKTISPYLSIMFILYTAFVCFAMMNVVTSYFVESTRQASEATRKKIMGDDLFEVFSYLKERHITRDMFYDQIRTPEMSRYLTSLDLSPETCEENHFFELLDTDGSGAIDLDELVHGCLRLRGPAKQIDLHCLGFTLQDKLEMLERAFNTLSDQVMTMAKRSILDGEKGRPSSPSNVLVRARESRQRTGQAVAVHSPFSGSLETPYKRTSVSGVSIPEQDLLD